MPIVRRRLGFQIQNVRPVTVVNGFLHSHFDVIIVVIVVEYFAIVVVPILYPCHVLVITNQFAFVIDAISTNWTLLRLTHNAKILI